MAYLCFDSLKLIYYKVKICKGYEKRRLITNFYKWNHQIIKDLEMFAISFPSSYNTFDPALAGKTKSFIYFLLYPISKIKGYFSRHVKPNYTFYFFYNFTVSCQWCKGRHLFNSINKPGYIWNCLKFAFVPVSCVANYVVDQACNSSEIQNYQSMRYRILTYFIFWQYVETIGLP